MASPAGPPLNSLLSPTGSIVFSRRSSSSFFRSSSGSSSLGAIIGGTWPSDSQACLQQSAMDMRFEGSICISLKMKSMPAALSKRSWAYVASEAREVGRLGLEELVELVAPKEQPVTVLLPRVGAHEERLRGEQVEGAPTYENGL